MGLWVLEDKHLEHVPGTSFINDTNPLHVHGGEAGHPQDIIVDTGRLKHATGRNSHIILVPQPSDDPNDPLNWPWWKKELLFWPMIFAAGLVGAIGPLLTPGFVELSIVFGVTVDKVASSLNGACVVAIGCGMLPMASLAQKYGRRPMFLLAALLLFVTCIWAGATPTNNFSSLTAARAIQGLAMTPLEALVTATIGDIYFVHERGFRVAVWGFAILGGINLAPIVNGPIIQNQGWQWCFWVIGILFGVSLILTFFTFPETAYKREEKYEIDGGSHDNVAALAIEENAEAEKAEMEHKEGVAVESRSIPPRRTFLQDLRIFSGVHDPTPLWKLIARPLPCFVSPVVIWATLAYGFLTVWLVVLSVTVSLIFGSPPYNFNSTQTGLVSISPLIGSLLAALIAGPVVDWCATGLAKRNNGVYEPEFRLLLCFPMLILEVLGYAVWGAVQAKGGPWIGPVLLYSIIDFGQGLGSTAVIAYVIDAHRGTVPEAFAVLSFIKNMVAFGFTYFVNSWIETQGMLNTFGTLAGLTAVCVLPTIPMYLYGKRVRSWIHRHQHFFLSDQLR
ncbi:MFS general substrate transporter [Dacryopinax primogenitus]|uniref:MFS general substrate transporter n=1 Tax=Dacryopinax primogenitus (strain DJM 731) TaxID=1858805 RepID=M5FUD2_DACPD|nr:MFS general substrate transporter [Dacryopinax primogenitus]EJT99823.1 MFS general substrate transporter [Dacryopinax primogenitus]